MLTLAAMLLNVALGNAGWTELAALALAAIPLFLGIGFVEAAPWLAIGLELYFSVSERVRVWVVRAMGVLLMLLGWGSPGGAGGCWLIEGRPGVRGYLPSAIVAPPPAPRADDDPGGAGQLERLRPGATGPGALAPLPLAADGRAREPTRHPREVPTRSPSLGRLGSRRATGDTELLAASEGKCV